MNKLKKIFVLTGFIQAVLLIIGYGLLYTYPNDLLLILLFVYSLFLGFFVIENRSPKLLANNTAIIFLIFLFLYGIYNAVIYTVIQGEMPADIYLASLIYALTIPAFIVTWLIQKPIRYDTAYQEQISIKRVNKAYSSLLLILLTSLIGYKSYFFISIGMFFNPSAMLGGNRFDLFKNISQLDVIFGLLITSIYLYFIFFYKQLSKKTLVYISVLLIYYILLQLSAGNRRDFIPIVLGAYWVYVNIKKIKFNFLGFLGILLMVLFFNYLGTIRAHLFSDHTSKQNDFIMTMTSNEFVYPFFTLSFEVDDYLRSSNYQFKNGETFVTYPVLTFIPRDIYSDKPISLANSFIRKFYGNRTVIGFAYTPVSEAFINFGILGPFFIYLIFGYLISNIQRNRNQILNFIFFAMIIDFSRGEIATFLYQFFFTAFFLLILPQFFYYFFLRIHHDQHHLR
ncbi:O-antigen polymerase [Chryseobacterium gotjawalense]|uniref:O-antigen polymerase n=1 Tax=Chryseobacterium gotjawalense TaxID=3042315 RepID=A0ABY8RIH8_9FLAO|nr:O-antigen polymerase [Chryseobacterium sp. wdc7]WHF53047.1 O-antigen polymerase [Chryseobacterium sp. wdc7]